MTAPASAALTPALPSRPSRRPPRRARSGAARSPTTAIARCALKSSPARCAGSAASTISSSTSPAGHSPKIDPDVLADPPPQPLSAASSRSRAGVGRRGRCGRSRHAAPESRAPRVRQRRAAIDAAQRHRLAAAAAAGRDRTIAPPRSRISASRTRIPTGWSARWLDRYGFDAERWVRFNNDRRR